MPIHPRSLRYKEQILDAPYAICIERARYFTQSYRKTEGEPPALRAAKAFAHTVAQMTIRIWDEERIAGNRSRYLVATIIPVERGDINIVLELELDALVHRERQPFHIDPDDRHELETEILPYWRGKTLRDRKKALWRDHGLWLRPAINPLSLWQRHRALDLAKLRRVTTPPGTGIKAMFRGVQELLYNNPAIVMNVFDVQGHLILGHKNILREGFAGVVAHARMRLEQAHAEKDGEGQAFLESVLLSCEAMRTYARRCAEAAEELAEQTAAPEKQAEYRAMAARCRRVPYDPPRDFREAVQALWLTQAGATIAYGMPAIFAPGRIDQHLNAFYERDLAEGLITEDEAVAWLEELLIKFSSNLLVLPHAGKQTGSELGSDSASPTIGGVDAAGRDAVNALSYLALDAFTHVKSLGNSFMIRLSKKTPDVFWRKALATHQITSGAALFCDEVVIESLKRCGMSEQDARDYGVIGCVEPAGDGNTFGCTSGNDLSLAAAVEMTLLNGRLRMMGRRIGPRTGKVAAFRTFDHVMSAYLRQVGFMVRTLAKAINLKDQAYRELYPCPLVSATLTGCVDHARDMTAGGAQYNYGSITGRGFATAVDSLAAIRHFVFEKQTFSFAEILHALDTNYRNAEPMRQRLIRQAPKFGCGHETADAIAQTIFEFFCREVAAQRTITGGPYRPGFFSYGMHVLEGLFLGATPDGRRAGDPISNSFSPVNHACTEGPTRVLQSVARVDHTLISNGCAVNVKMMPSLFQGERNLSNAVALIKTYFTLGGMEVQLNAVSNETLRDAQQHPERHRDLVVRVSGYSALFTDLGPALQDEIIQRTAFESE